MEKNKAGRGKTETQFGIETTEGRGKNRQSGKSLERKIEKEKEYQEHLKEYSKKKKRRIEGGSMQKR